MQLDEQSVFFIVAILAGLVIGIISIAIFGDARVLGAALFVLVTLLSPVYIWVKKRSARRGCSKAARGLLEEVLKQAQTQIAADEEPCLVDSSWCSAANRDERRRQLGAFGAALDSARRVRDLQKIEEELDRARERYLTYLLCVQAQKASALVQATTAVFGGRTGDGGARSDALTKIRALAESASREIEATTPRPGRFAVAKDGAVERAEALLSGAAAAAVGTELPAPPAVLRPTVATTDIAALSVVDKLLDATRKLDSD